MATEETKRMGFYFDQNSCVGCKTCQVACKDKNDLEVGTLFRHVVDFEVGEFPSVKSYHYAATCNHCENPACVEACPTEAMYIDETDGTVQHDDEKCIGCQYCVQSCPYSVPQYLEEQKMVHKCDACYVLRQNGERPLAWPHAPCARSNSASTMTWLQRIPMPSTKLRFCPILPKRARIPSSTLARRRSRTISARLSCKSTRPPTSRASIPPSWRGFRVS